MTTREKLSGQHVMERIVKALHPRETDTYQTMRDMMVAAVHEPEYAFYVHHWVDYKHEAKYYRLKLQHDIRLKDGREFLGMYPNANAWSGKGGRFTDEQVTHIRVSKYQIADVVP